VFHLAGKALVEESIHNPQIYTEVNREGTKKILEVMNELGTNRIFFASTCSVYGNTHVDNISEETDLDPINPYAESKLEADKLIENYAKLDDFTGISFRFFNVSGAYFSKTQKWFGESHETETHLIPNLINWIEKGDFTIYGTDWDTADGTAIRDYVHVVDIAKAFYLAATNKMISGNQIFNLGSEIGYSIKQVIETVEKVTNNKIKVVVGERRKGDPVKLVANSNKFKKISGWYPESSLEKTIDDSIKYFNYKASYKFQGK
jgi:UDP-glucose 4-epimerase